MTRLILRASHHAAFRCAGWAWVRRGAEPAGQAGGARQVDSLLRGQLAGLVAALKDLPEAAPLELDLGDPRLAGTLRRLAEGPPLTPDEAPTEALDLWAPLATGLAGRKLVVVADPPAAAFAQAWADLARDKAKATGPFAAAIPKTNLAKLG